MRKAIINYFKNFNIFFPVIKSVILSVVLGTALFILDFYNVPTHVLSQIPSTILVVCVLSALIIVFCWLFHIHFFGLFLIASANILDVIFVSSFFAILAYYLFNLTLLQSKSLFPCAIICFVFAASVVFRIVFHFYSQKKAQCLKTNVLDLKDLYNNTFDYTGHGPILIEETEVSYDLLNRGHLINWLAYSIQNCKSAQSFVIGLEGPWGSGKTTIINNVKRILSSDSQSFYIINDFDPWAFGTQEALLWGMYDAIFKSSGTKFSILRSHRMMEQLSSAVVDNYTAGRLIKPIAFDSKNGVESLSEIKEKISAYLQTKNQTIVFFIDNIDRAEAKNVIFLFKLIGTVFSLPKVIYVLSYDRTRVNNIFDETNDVDTHYVDKIIQQEIKVPVITNDQAKALYSVCIENLLLAYGVKKENISSFIPLANYIYSVIPDLRQFKRLINSTFSIAFCQETALYKPDLLALETIRFVDPILYSQIYQNRQYFISHDIMYDAEIWHWSFDEKEFNEQGKVFFDSLFTHNAVLKDLLTAVFPYVERYKNRQELISKYYSGSDEEYSHISNDMRICSAKYFDLYFNYSSNNYLEISKNIDDFVLIISTLKDYDSIENLLKSVLMQISSDNQKEWFEQLQSRIKLCKSNCYYLSKSLFGLIHAIDDSLYFMALSAKQRCEVIIAQILCSCTDLDFSDFLSAASNEYGKIEIIRELAYWVEHQKDANEEIIASRKEQLEQLHKSLCKTVFDNNINLYSNDYYHPRNIRGLYSYCKEVCPEAFKPYIASIISEQSIYRIIWDITARSIGSEYSYSISKESLDIFFDDTTIIENIFSSTQPKTESEKFVKEIYMSFKDGKADFFGDKAVKSTEEIKPTL